MEIDHEIFAAVILSLQEGQLSVSGANLMFSYFCTKTYVVGTHWKHLTKVFSMSTTTYVFVNKQEKYQYFLVEQ